MRSVLFVKSDRRWWKNQQRAQLCEGIKALAVELSESCSKEDHMKVEVLTVISTLNNRLCLLKDMIEENDLPEDKRRKLKLYAQEFIARHSARELNLNNFSRFLGYSSKYCSRLFKAQTGETFSHYTTRLRVDMAKHMLLETSQSVSGIAELVGFSDPFVFSHFFKRIVGRSPMNFRSKKSNGRVSPDILQPATNILLSRTSNSACPKS